MKKTYVLFLCVVAYNICSFGQVQHAGWLAAFYTFKLNNKISIHNDVQWRSSDELKHTQSFLFRLGINVAVNKTVVTSGGYAWIRNRRTTGNVAGYAPEHRIWEQLVVNHKTGRLLTAHRFRLEQRFISKTIVENNNLKTDGSFFASRFRYFLRNILPVRKSEKFEKGCFIALQNELFFNIGDNSNLNNAVFDQNRFYLAVGYRLNRQFDLEAGYLNQYIRGRDRAFSNIHIAQLAGYVRL